MTQTTRHVMSYVDLSLAFHEAVRKFDDSGYIDQEQCVSGIKFHKMMNQYAAEILHDEVPYYPAVLPISDYQVMRTCPALRRAVAVAAYSRDFASMTNRDSNALMTMTMPGAAAINGTRNEALMELVRHEAFRSLIKFERPDLLAKLEEYAVRVAGLPSLAERTFNEKVKLHIDLMMTPEFRLLSRGPAAEYLKDAEIPQAREMLAPMARFAMQRRDEGIANALQNLERTLKLV